MQNNFDPQTGELIDDPAAEAVNAVAEQVAEQLFDQLSEQLGDEELAREIAQDVRESIAFEGGPEDPGDPEDEDFEDPEDEDEDPYDPDDDNGRAPNFGQRLQKAMTRLASQSGDIAAIGWAASKIARAQKDVAQVQSRHEVDRRDMLEFLERIREDSHDLSHALGTIGRNGVAEHQTGAAAACIRAREQTNHRMLDMVEKMYTEIRMRDFASDVARLKEVIDRVDECNLGGDGVHIINTYIEKMLK